MGSKLPIVEVDLRQADLEDLIVFLFRRRSSGRDPRVEQWYWKKDYRLKIDPARQIALMTELFSRSARIRRRYTKGQIEDGFWYVFGPAGWDCFKDQFWNRRVAWTARRRCIESIPRLYEGVFRSSDTSISFMLWDLLTEDYRFGHRNPKRSRDARRVQLAMVRALEDQLSLRHREAQRAALHGLGHLKMPEARRCIRAYLRRPRLSRWLTSYAEEALRGKVL